MTGQPAMLSSCQIKAEGYLGCVRQRDGDMQIIETQYQCPKRSRYPSIGRQSERLERRARPLKPHVHSYVMAESTGKIHDCVMISGLLNPCKSRRCVRFTCNVANSLPSPPPPFCEANPALNASQNIGDEWAITCSDPPVRLKST